MGDEGRDVGRRIRMMRKTRGMSQERLANLVGVARSTVAQWETGRTVQVDFKTLMRVGQVLGVNARWLAIADVSPVPVIFPSTEESMLVEAFRRLSEAERDEVLAAVRSYANRAKKFDPS